MRTIPTKRFIQQLDDLLHGNKKYGPKVIKAMKLVEFDLKHPSLRLHKLSGIEEVYSVSVDMKIRILIAIDNNHIRLLEIGTHDEVY